MVSKTLMPSGIVNLPHFPVGVSPKLGAVRAAVGDDTPMRLDVSDYSEISPFGTPCFVSIKAEALPKAMIKVQIDAPCLPYARVISQHAGLTVGGEISLTGTAEMIFPALAQDADLRIDIDNDQTLITKHIPDFDKFARVVLFSDQKDPAVLGARNLAVLNVGSAQVISVDLRERRDLKVHRLTLLREVTAQNCGQPQEAELRQIMPGKTVQSRTFRFAAIGCERVGEILRLKNIIEDLKLAAN